MVLSKKLVFFLFLRIYFCENGEKIKFLVAQLLSCLHDLKMENVRLGETLSSLMRRRDHLLALNARLSIPFNNISSSFSSNYGFVLHSFII